MTEKKDVGFIGALCKSKERLLIGEEKFARMIDTDTAEDAFRMLRESGFGGDAEASGARDFEKLIAAETESFNRFLREYAPGENYAEALLLANDFHNADCLVRIAHGYGGEGMLKEDGYYSVAEIRKATEGSRAELPEELLTAIRSANKLFDDGEAGGAKLTTLFLNAYYARMAAICPDKLVKKAIAAEIDAKNIAVAMRSADAKTAKEMRLAGGTLTDGDFATLTGGDLRRIRSAFLYSPLRELVDAALDEKEKNAPLIGFERLAEGAFLKTLKQRRYETEGAVPYLLYAYYKRNELINVRVVMAGKLCGAEKERIRGRLREGYDG